MALFVSGAYPEFGFWTTSGEAIFMIMLGGVTTFIGPIVGAVLLLLEHFVTRLTEYHGLVLGIVILAIVLGLRQGVLDFVVDWFAQRARRQPARSATSRCFADPRALDKRFGGVHATATSRSISPTDR